MSTPPRKLIFLRHGKSGYPVGVSDHNRPLTLRGKTQAEIVGRWFARDGYSIDTVLCSTALRTRETLASTKILEKNLLGAQPTAAPRVEFCADLYAASPDKILETIRIYTPENAETVLVIGHNPGLPLAALELDPRAEISQFPTSTYATLTIETSFAQLGLLPGAHRLTGIFSARE